MLLHGLASSARIWDFVAPRLAERHRVVAVDQRGHGLSDRADDYSFAAVTADVEALIDTLDIDRAILGGHSWGANVAVQAAAEQPSRVRGLVMVDGGIIDISERLTWEQAEKQLRPPEIDGIPVEAFVAGARQWPDLSSIWSDDMQEVVLSTLSVRDGRVYRRLPIADHMRIVHALYEQRPTALLGRIECPALAVLAAREPANEVERRWMDWRRRGAALAETRMTDGRVIWMDDSIHDLPLQRPAELAGEIIGFAAGLP